MVHTVAKILVSSERRLLAMVCEKLLEDSPVEDEAFTDGLRCPITLEPFLDPVVACDGRTYEREAIARHFQSNGVISPVTNEILCSPALYPSLQTISNMRWWCEKEVVKAFGFQGPFPGEYLFLKFLEIDEKPEPIYIHPTRIVGRLKAPDAPVRPTRFAVRRFAVHEALPE